MKIFVILLVSLVTGNQGFLARQFETIRQFYYSLTQNYDHTKSIQYFYYTKIAVCHPEEIANWDCGYYCEKHPGMVDVESFTGDYSSQAYCGYNQNENLIVLVYRSTQDLTNFINDVKFFKHEFGDCFNCYVHLGFWETYTAISTGMISCTQKLKQKHQSAKILVTGHSLGGAIAAMMAVDVTRLGHKVDYFFTYGAPRIGNTEFAQWFYDYVTPNEFWRVVHYADTVVHSPPMSFYYSHLPQEVWYTEEQVSYKICQQGLIEDSTCSNSLWWYSISDHTSYFNEFQTCKTAYVHHNETSHYIQ